MACGGTCGCNDCYGSSDCLQPGKSDTCVAPRGSYATLAPERTSRARSQASPVLVPDFPRSAQETVLWGRFGGQAVGVLAPGHADPTALLRLLGFGGEANPGLVERSDALAPGQTPFEPEGQASPYVPSSGQKRLPGVPFPEDERGKGGGGIEPPPEEEPEDPCICYCTTSEGAEASVAVVQEQFEHSRKHYESRFQDLYHRIDPAPPPITPPVVINLGAGTVPDTGHAEENVLPDIDVEAMFGSDPTFLTDPGRVIPAPTESQSSVVMDLGLPVGGTTLAPTGPLTTGMPATPNVATDRPGRTVLHA